ncbi:Uncharacterized protein APZ42_001461 [Daphnia magna]|uniref:Uncharacterized protein n=1 Tax=Daphnia magna TaxID=35525 RepID=A0A164IYY1_9CRUS|nr:Uncharacterized protein APZ42_001461 [Daphnia magna]
MMLVVEWILMTLPIMVLPIKNDRRSDLGADFWLDQSGQFCFLLLLLRFVNPRPRFVNPLQRLVNPLPRFSSPMPRFRHGLSDAAIHVGSLACSIICQMMGILQLQDLLADLILIPNLKLGVFFCVCLIWFLSKTFVS